MFPWQNLEFPISPSGVEVSLFSQFSLKTHFAVSNAGCAVPWLKALGAPEPASPCSASGGFPARLTRVCVLSSSGSLRFGERRCAQGSTTSSLSCF